MRMPRTMMLSPSADQHWADMDVDLDVIAPKHPQRYPPDLRNKPERSRHGRQRQPSATSNAVTLRASRLNSTPIRWIGSPRPRYFAA